MANLLSNRYEILRPLGKGGFGATYLAADRQMPSGRRCVVKQLLPQGTDPQTMQLVRERFEREATILEDVGNGHGQIPDLFAFFNEQGQFYLVQEWVDGLTLMEQMEQQGPWSEEKVRALLTEILPVLSYIHGKGVIHRDIKPDNIILRASDQQPVLIDFGAVKETMGTQLNSAGNSINSIVIGTPGYMPSEQGAGRPVFSSDLFSLGLTVILLLTGKHPSELTTDPLTGEIQWRDWAPAVSPGFRDILDRAIYANARDRYPTAQAMLQALQGQRVSVTAPTVLITEPATLVVSPGQQQSPTASSVTPTSVATPQAGGMSSWLKMMITGSVIGVFILSAIALAQLPRLVSSESAENSNRRDPDVATDINAGTTTPSSTNQTETPTTSPSESSGVSSSTSPTPSPATEPPRSPVPQPQPSPKSQSTESQSTLVSQVPTSPSPTPELTPTPTTSQSQPEPSPPTPKPSPTSPLTTSPETAPTPRPSAEQSVQSYYDAVNRGQYRESWERLPTSMQNDARLHPDGYVSYTNWWEQVANVDVLGTSIIAQNESKMVVNTDLRYAMMGGRQFNMGLQFHYAWNDATQDWQISHIRHRYGG